MANGGGKSKSVEITNWIREVPKAPIQNIHQRLPAPAADAAPPSSLFPLVDCSYFSCPHCSYVLLFPLARCHKFHNLSYTQLWYALCSVISCSRSPILALVLASHSHTISIFLSSAFAPRSGILSSAQREQSPQATTMKRPPN